MTFQKQYGIFQKILVGHFILPFLLFREQLRQFQKIILIILCFSFCIKFFQPFLQAVLVFDL